MSVSLGSIFSFALTEKIYICIYRCIYICNVGTPRTPSRVPMGPWPHVPMGPQAQELLRPWAHIKPIAPTGPRVLEPLRPWAHAVVFFSTHTIHPFSSTIPSLFHLQMLCSVPALFHVVTPVLRRIVGESMFIGDAGVREVVIANCGAGEVNDSWRRCN